MNTILLVVAIFGLILTTLLFLNKAFEITSTFFLAFFYFIFSIYALQTYVITSGQISEFSWFYAWPLPIYGLFCVPIYFYFTSIIDDGFTWKWRYLLLFVPFLLSCIDVLVLFSKPDSVYDAMILNADLYPKKRFSAVYGLLSLNTHFILRHVWQFVCLFVIWPKLRNFLRLGSSEKLKITLNRWLLFFYISLLVMSFLLSIFGMERGLNIDILLFIFRYPPITAVVRLLLYLVVLGIGVIPVYFPSILYGFPRAAKEGPVVAVPTKNREEPKYGLDVKGIGDKLLLMKQKELFLEQDFDLTACARELEIPAHHLSYFLNQSLGHSFSSYRNHLRMEKAKSLIQSGFLDVNTVEALAWACGFASRSGFSKTFKNLTGQSLSEYLSKVRDNTH